LAATAYPASIAGKPEDKAFWADGSLILHLRYTFRPLEIRGM